MPEEHKKRLSDLGYRILADLTQRPFSRAVIVTTICMTWRVTEWAFDYARMTHEAGGNDVALTIGAVTAPFALLQAFVFKTYTDGKKEG